jgi:alkanesulfonate monooxygenase SsuD/methylene tetrahydromethanopterin reductase-like flavin-dependent oxidoreductase (luciferase family)
MDLGLHLSNFTWPGGPATFTTDLARAAQLAEDVGFTKLSVMDHIWQIANVGPPEHEMLEAYTTLGYLAAKTDRIELLAWVTAAIYREPGMLAKQATTLDVLRGLGAALGRDYDDIEKTVIARLDPGPNGEQVDDVLAELQDLAGIGITHTHTSLKDTSSTKVFEIFGDRIIPEAAKF